MCPICGDPLDLHSRDDAIACLASLTDWTDDAWRDVENVNGPTLRLVFG